MAARPALTPLPRILGYGDRMDTQTSGKGLGVFDVFKRRPWGAGAAWSTGAALLGLGLTALTTLVATGRTVGLDRWVDETVPRRGGGPAPLHFVAQAITTVANPPVTMALLLTVVALWAIWSRTPWPVVAAAPAVVALTVTVLAGKWLLARPGPPGSDVVDSLGYYPSGHTATALVCTGTLAVLVARRHPHYRRGLTLAVTVWTTLVAWSLLWLHFHWLCDVVGAALLGALLLWLLYRWPWFLVAPPSRRSEGTDVGTGSQESVAPRPGPTRSR
jgi:membrane-associated phospholipid phosphatase